MRPDGETRTQAGDWIRPQVMADIVEIVRTIPVDALVPQIWKIATGAVVEDERQIAQERIQQRTVEQIVVVHVP